MPAKKPLQCALNYFSTVGVTASVEASFVLRRRGSIALPGPKFGKQKKEDPHRVVAWIGAGYSMGVKGGRWRTADGSG